MFGIADTVGKAKISEISRKLAPEQAEIIFAIFLDVSPVASRVGVMQQCKKAANYEPAMAALRRRMPSCIEKLKGIKSLKSMDSTDVSVFMGVWDRAAKRYKEMRTAFDYIQASRQTKRRT